MSHPSPQADGEAILLDSLMANLLVSADTSTSIVDQAFEDLLMSSQSNSGPPQTSPAPPTTQVDLQSLECISTSSPLLGKGAIFSAHQSRQAVETMRKEFRARIIDVYVNKRRDHQPSLNEQAQEHQEQVFKGYFDIHKGMYGEDASEQFLNTAFNMLANHIVHCQAQSNKYTKMKEPLEDVLKTCSQSNLEQTYLEDIQYIYAQFEEPCHGDARRNNNTYSIPVFSVEKLTRHELAQQRSKHTNISNPHPMQGSLMEGLVIEHLNTGFQCPECGSRECFAPIANDVDGVYSSAWRDCVCTRCFLDNQTLTLFEIKTRASAQVRANARDFSTQGGSYGALNELAKANKTNVYLVVFCRDTGEVYYGKVTRFVPVPNENFLYAVEQVFLHGKAVLLPGKAAFSFLDEAYCPIKTKSPQTMVYSRLHKARTMPECVRMRLRDGEVDKMGARVWEEWLDVKEEWVLSQEARKAEVEGISRDLL